MTSTARNGIGDVDRREIIFAFQKLAFTLFSPFFTVTVYNHHLTVIALYKFRKNNDKRRVRVKGQLGTVGCDNVS